MNLSVLERLACEGDVSLDSIRYLLGCRAECEWLDYKETLDLGSDKGVADFGKDALAIKNSGGGFIVVGVRDKSWQAVGLQSPFPYDTKMLRDKILKATGVSLDVTCVTHNVYVDGADRTFVLVLIRASRKRTRRRTPTTVAIDFKPREPYGLRRGEIYVRRCDSTVRVSSSEELADLLDALEDQADEDARRLNASPSPFAVAKGTYRLLERGFDSFIGRTHLREALLSALFKDPRIWIINVHGPGGVGKSALVNWVVYECFEKGHFESIVHLTAKETQLTAHGIRPHSRTLYSLENLVDAILETFEQESKGDLENKKATVLDCLGAWKTLLVLDNMETVHDGRIIDFVRSLPPDTKAKVLLTSRTLTGGWELPVPITELSIPETKEFLEIKARELQVQIPENGKFTEKVWAASGGLPLAIMWILGRMRLGEAPDKAIAAVTNPNSPVLEFSFRNMWALLSAEARQILALASIFDEPPTAELLRIATDRPPEWIERGLGELERSTLVRRVTQPSDGRVTFAMLPITMSFARNQMSSFGDFEGRCRERLQKFADQMRLNEAETARFKNVFFNFGIDTDNERRAAILCRRGESELFMGNVESAEQTFAQARGLAPQSSYVLAMSASFELARNRITNALDFAKDACRLSTKWTRGLCHTILARAHFAAHQHTERAAALKVVVEEDPNDVLARHQYGVALSRSGRTHEAINEFSKMIEAELKRTVPRNTIIFALKTRIINLRRLGRDADAKRDIDLANELFKTHPHLAHLAREIMDLE